MREENLAAIAGDLNGVPATAARTRRLSELVEDTNKRVRDAADECITLDATPFSFQAMKADCESGQ